MTTDKATATPPADAPLATVDARYRDLLNRLGCNGHDGAIAEIASLRRHLDAQHDHGCPHAAIDYDHPCACGVESADAALDELALYLDRMADRVRTDVMDCARLRQAAAALRARQPAQAAAVPEGFVMVPVEPTEEMLSVAVDNWSGYEEESGRFYTPLDSDVRILWKALLAASKGEKP